MNYASIFLFNPFDPIATPSNVSGVLWYVQSKENITNLLDNHPHSPYIVILEPHLFTRYVINNILLQTLYYTQDTIFIVHELYQQNYICLYNLCDIYVCINTCICIIQVMHLLVQ